MDETLDQQAVPATDPATEAQVIADATPDVVQPAAETDAEAIPAPSAEVPEAPAVIPLEELDPVAEPTPAMEEYDAMEVPPPVKTAKIADLPPVPDVQGDLPAPTPIDKH